MAEHPRPWKLGFNDGSGVDSLYITDANDEAVVHGQGDCCHCGGFQDPDLAALTVRIVNSHDDLLAALEGAEWGLNYLVHNFVNLNNVPQDQADQLRHVIHQARAAIAKARGG